MHFFKSFLCGILKSQTYIFFLFSQVDSGCKPMHKHKTKGNETSTEIKTQDEKK